VCRRCCWVGGIAGARRAVTTVLVAGLIHVVREDTNPIDAGRRLDDRCLEVVVCGIVAFARRISEPHPIEVVAIDAGAERL
jgi:hypothetical protein